MAEGHAALGGLDAVAEQERFDVLHEELGRLPEAFRSVLVVCDLEGSTQEQAALELRCPLGTVQSRLAHGRARLKARLKQRGLEFSGFAGADHATTPLCPPPAAWTEATVNLAMRFAHKSSLGIANAAAATMAEEVLRAVVMTKLTLAAGVILVGLVLVSGAALWAGQERKATVPLVTTKAVNENVQPAPPQHQQTLDAPEEWVPRTFRGIVRDEKGRPVAKAWVGGMFGRRDDQWKIVLPLDRIRERIEPFRDDRGNIVPPGALGKYFELRDEAGKWQPIHPAQVRRFEKPRDNTPMPRERNDLVAEDVAPTVMTAIERGAPVFEVAVTGRCYMLPEDPARGWIADRTDSQGSFTCESTISRRNAKAIYIASPDFSRRAIHVVRFDDPDKPAEITLRPVRVVRARVIETPRDVPGSKLNWQVYSVDPADGRLSAIPVIGQVGSVWDDGFLECADAKSTPGAEPWLEICVPAGRYKLTLESDTLYRGVDLVVPPGDQPLDLPDLHVERLAWAKMLGKPAAEIEAVDLDEHPIKLADFRGKVVVLAFWTSTLERQLEIAARLRPVLERFEGQPVAIVALQDCSLISLADLKKAAAQLDDRRPDEIPIRFLLDRPPVGKALDSTRRPRGRPRNGADGGSLRDLERSSVLERLHGTRGRQEW